MPIHLVLAVMYLRSSLDTEGPAGMRGASRGGKDVGTRAIETRRRSKQRRQEAQPYDEATRTCTDEVRGHQQKRRSETTAVREALRHRPGQYEVLVPRQRTCSICMSIACRKNSLRVRQRSKATANLMVAQQLSWIWILSSKKTRPGSRRRARRVVRGEGGEEGAKSGVFYF